MSDLEAAGALATAGLIAREIEGAGARAGGQALHCANGGALTRRSIDGPRARYASPLALFLLSVFLMFFVFSFGGGQHAEAGWARQLRASKLRINTGNQKRDAALRHKLENPETPLDLPYGTLIFGVPVLHMFLQLKGSYALGNVSALWRTLVLLGVAGTSFLSVPELRDRAHARRLSPDSEGGPPGRHRCFVALPMRRTACSGRQRIGPSRPGDA